MHILNKWPLHGAVAREGRMHRSGSQEVEARVFSLSFTSDDPLWEFVLPSPETLGSDQLGVVLVPPWLPTGLFKLLMPRDEGKKRNSYFGRSNWSWSPEGAKAVVTQWAQK